MTQRTARAAHPEHPQRPEKFGELIHAFAALQADASASRIRALWKRSSEKVGNHPNTTAAWDALCALRVKTETCVEDARKNGTLLFCWHGTRSLNGGAA